MNIPAAQITQTEFIPVKRRMDYLFAVPVTLSLQGLWDGSPFISPAGLPDVPKTEFLIKLLYNLEFLNIYSIINR
jgi:hypothetical protein